MCMVLYIASDKQLPVIGAPVYTKDFFDSPDWPTKAQPFHTADLKPEEDSVRSHFRYPHVLYAGSYENCGCGFNFNREYPEQDPNHIAAAKRSVDELVQYILKAGVRQIYSCWSGDEAEPAAHERTVTSTEIGSQEFFFRERELLTIANDDASS